MDKVIVLTLIIVFFVFSPMVQFVCSREYVGISSYLPIDGK